jgi:hypothetical protein
MRVVLTLARINFLVQDYNLKVDDRIGCPDDYNHTGIGILFTARITNLGEQE